MHLFKTATKIFRLYSSPRCLLIFIMHRTYKCRNLDLANAIKVALLKHLTKLFKAKHRKCMHQAWKICFSKRVNKEIKLTLNCFTTHSTPKPLLRNVCCWTPAHRWVTWQDADVTGNEHRSVIEGDVDSRNHPRPLIYREPTMPNVQYWIIQCRRH